MRRPSGTSEMPSSTRACGGSRPISSPSNRTSPDVTGTLPATAPSSVDLPAPFAPMIASVSPSSTSQADAEERLEVPVEAVDALEAEQRQGASAPR